MRFFILGGNGRTGQEVVSEAISRGHTVTALVRDPSRVEPQQGLTLYMGSPLNESDVMRVFDSEEGKVDVVVVALNAPRKSDSPFAKSIAPPNMMFDSVQNTLAVMRKYKVSRIIVMQAFGVGKSYTNLNFLMRAVMSYTEMSKQMADHNHVAELLESTTTESDISWTMVRPAMLKGEEFLPVKVLEPDGKGASFMPQISRKSVARFMVRECAEEGGFKCESPVIRN